VAQEDLGGGPLALFVDLDGVAGLRVEASWLDGNMSRHLGRGAASTERWIKYSHDYRLFFPLKTLSVMIVPCASELVSTHL
jgi:hypothetical protein